MSIKIKCEIVSKGITLPTDKIGLEWVRTVWLWLSAYTSSEIHGLAVDDIQQGKIVACLQLLNDMSVITDETLEKFLDDVHHSKCIDLHETAKKQAQLAIGLYWNA